ncbi:MAG: phage BR0599 family protein, partial [Rhizobiales bacterium]|nr:phage BR0599 family protein [Hyphomicrobiales bacterium]
TVDLEAAEFRGVGIVTNVDGADRFTADGLDDFADDWFSGGVVTWLSGANQGQRRAVKQHRSLSGVVTLSFWQAMSAPIVAGDTFAVTAGCDKQFATCRVKFANAANFRGFPHMPGNDFVASYPNRDDPKNDGGSRQ